MRCAFLWDGITEHYGKRFTDGLWLALKHLEKRHTVGYFEPHDKEHIDEFQPDVLLYWGALCENSKPLVTTYEYPKAICFAGGPIDAKNVEGFDLYFTESEINERELTFYGKKWKRAFGINEDIFQPQRVTKEYDAAIWASFAKWKRHNLFAAATGEMGVAIGQHQSHEPECYLVCEQWGVRVLPESGKQRIVELANRAYCALNTAEFWGGGQRMTLEAMSMNVPPIVMSDSPKNMEYILESGYGIICDPDIADIQKAIAAAKTITVHTGRDYVLSKYSSQHYADALEEGLLCLV